MIQKLPRINLSRTKGFADDAYRYAYNGDSRVEASLLEFYKEAVHCPSVAKVIARKSIVDGLERYKKMVAETVVSSSKEYWALVKDYFTNSVEAIAIINEAKYDRDIKEYYDVFEKKFKETLYPTTHKIREKIIEDGRVVYGQVTPRKSLGLRAWLRYSKLFAEANAMKSHN